jgi:hypothetical protein
MNYRLSWLSGKSGKYVRAEIGGRFMALAVPEG